MMDSMTNNELDGKHALDEQRIIRISRGSGTGEMEVYQMIAYHKQMSTIVGKMGKNKMFGKNPAQMKNMMANKDPGAMMRSMGINPQMLQQMGGANGMMNMLKGMGGAGGMAEMMAGTLRIYINGFAICKNLIASFYFFVYFCVGMDMNKMAGMMKGLNGIPGASKRKKVIRGRR